MRKNVIDGILCNRYFFLFSKIVLTFMFWASGLAKLFDYQGTLLEMRHFGLRPPALFAVAVIITELAGSVLVVGGRHVWLGAGALAVFTLLTIPIAHDFWNMTGDAAFNEKMVVIEHLTVVGALMLVASARGHLTTDLART